MKPEFHETKYCIETCRQGSVTYGSDLCVVVDAATNVPVFYHAQHGGGDFVESYPDPQCNSPVVVYEREIALALIGRVQQKYSRQNIAPNLRRHYGLMNVYSTHLPDTEPLPEEKPDTGKAGLSSNDVKLILSRYKSQLDPNQSPVGGSDPMARD